MAKNKMTRQEAKEYLASKSKTESGKVIKEVMKRGKIYGDPMVVLDE